MTDPRPTPDDQDRDAGPEGVSESRSDATLAPTLTSELGALMLRLLGTGSPRPQLERAGPAQAVGVGDRWYVVDCGDRATTRLMEAGVPATAATTLLFTHLHTDHTVGYSQFVLGGWALGRRALRVLGPPGPRRLHALLFAQVYAEDVAYRLSLGRDPRGLTEAVTVHDVDSGVVLEEDGLRVTAAWVVHQVPTLAYRFDYRGQSLVLSGDTAPCDSLVALARGADVLVQDCCLDPTSREAWLADPSQRAIWERISHEHCTPEQAGALAEAAGVRTLVLTHFLHQARAEPTLAAARSTFGGEVIFGQDLLALRV